MTDLITRLLADADAWDPPDAPGAAPHDGPETAQLEREAAKEIERLRGAPHCPTCGCGGAPA